MMTNKETLLTVTEVAERLSVSRQTVYGLINSGKLPSILFGRNRRIKTSAFDNFIESSVVIVTNN